jgi:hypothetical protein
MPEMVVTKTYDYPPDRIGSTIGRHTAAALPFALTSQKWEGYMDIYTKVVLTIIAVALSIMALREAGVPALAQSSALTRIVVCGAEANPRAYGQLGCASVLTDNNGLGRLLIAQ